MQFSVQQVCVCLVSFAFLRFLPEPWLFEIVALFLHIVIFWEHVETYRQQHVDLVGLQNPW